MKEFIDKLIGRLEEEIVYDTFDNYKEEPLINMSFEKLEDIINQLEEEYNNIPADISNDLMVVASLPSLYPLKDFEEEAIHRVVGNNGWIPCSERLPAENIEVDVTVEEIDGGRYTKTSWLQDGCWVIKKSPLEPKVIAWKERPAHYQPKGE